MRKYLAIVISITVLLTAIIGTSPAPAVSGNIAALATVTASSETVSTGQTARKAVDGSADGYPGDATREWATENKGVGAWLKLVWTIFTPIIKTSFSIL